MKTPLAICSFLQAAPGSPPASPLPSAPSWPMDKAIGLHGLAIGEGDRAVSWLPFYHDMGLVGFFLVPMCCQATVDILSPRDFARRPLIWLKPDFQKSQHDGIQPVFRL